MTLAFSGFAPGGRLMTGDRVVGLRSGTNTIFTPTLPGNILAAQLTTTIPTQLLANTFYTGVVASPSPAVGIMPVTPTAGDVLIVAAVAAAGVTIQKGTAAVVDIGGTPVGSTFFLPIGSVISLRCTNAAGGGQWAAEALQNSTLIDGVTTQNAISNIQLNKSNNLSDVSNAVTSLSNIGGQPINLSGTGNPNGAQAGTAGVNIYFDTAAQQYWACTVTGTSSTAVWQNLSTESVILPANILYFSGSIGSDITGNGSQSFPFATYNFAVSVAVGLATIANQYAVFPMGQERVTGDIVLYPFVSIVGLSPDVNQINTAGNVVADSSWDSTPNGNFSANNVGITAGSGVNITLNVPQGANFIFHNSPFINTPSMAFTGTDSPAEIFAYINCIDLQNSPTATFTDFISTIDNSTISDVTLVNTSSAKQSILIIDNASILDDGPITVQTTGAGQGAALFASATVNLNNLTIDGIPTVALLDVVSYPINLTFLNGATVSNISLLNILDGINANANFTPLNYVPVAGPTWAAESGTGNLAGIDVALASLNTFPSITLTNANNQVKFGTTTNIILNVPAPAASRLYTLPDVFADATIWMLNTNNTRTLNGPFVMDDSPNSNTSIGLGSMTVSSTAKVNVSIGVGANGSLGATTNGQTTSVGAFAGGRQIGNANTFIGASAGNGNAAGASANVTVAVGTNALRNIFSGVQNVAVGNSAGLTITSGTANVCLGFNAGNAVISGSNNIFLGGSATAASTTTNAIVIGHGITGSADNEIIIGNGSAAQMRADSVGLVSIGATSHPYKNLILANGASSTFTISPRNSARTRIYYLSDTGVDGAVAINLLQEVDACSNLIYFDVLVSFSQLSGGARAILYASFPGKTYKIRDLKINSNGTNFVGGDRNLSISDGSTFYSVIPSANLLALTNQGWGSAALPYPASAAISTTTTSGSNISALYSGGTLDYTDGQILISGAVERIS